VEVKSVRTNALGLCLLFVFGTCAAQNQHSAISVQPEVLRKAKIDAPPQSAVLRASALRGALQPTAKAWIEEQAKIEMKRPAPDLNALRGTIQRRFADSLVQKKPDRAKPSSPDGSQQGIDSIVLLVMMEAAQDSETELQNMMQQMQRQNDQKRALRQLHDEMVKEAALKPGQTGGTCVSAFCRSLPERIASFNQASAEQSQPVHLQVPTTVSYQQLASMEQNLNQNVDIVNEMSEATALQLQMEMDRRSKLMQTLSNLMKSIGDTDSAIVQNLK
jgi:hypothetical protein